MMALKLLLNTEILCKMFIENNEEYNLGKNVKY